MLGFDTIFNAIFIIVPIFILICMLITFITILSPKARSKMLKRHIQTMKYVYDDNEDMLRDIAKTGANISKEAISIKTRAVKDGFDSSDYSNAIYCKNCGGKIDSDSAYCKHCGKEQ